MATPEQTEQPADGKTQLTRHFEARALDKHTDGWSNLWDTDLNHFWDRGTPSPALVDLLEDEERRDLVSPDTKDGRRKKALVPGCGKGYDVVMLALHGFDVYGLEVSAKGVSVAKEHAKNELASPQAYNFGASGKPAQHRGEVTILQGDFFASDWEIGSQFDLIYDYTFLCALHPSMRPRWASRMADLLAPAGSLVCLEFPMYKDPKLPGPPWGLNGVHWDLLAEGGDGIVSGEGVRGEGKGKFTRVLYVKPERSYENGKGTDMLSVWGRK